MSEAGRRSSAPPPPSPPSAPTHPPPTPAPCLASSAGSKSVDQGWIGYYIDNVEGDRRLVDPMVDRPGSQGRIQWSQQFLQGKTKCGDR